MKLNDARACCGVLVLASQIAGWSPAVADDRAAVAAAASQSVHPVLIRNQYNPVLQLTIDAQQQGITLRAVHFALDGADDVGDIETLELFVTGAKPEFATSVRFAKSCDPAGTIVFRGEHVLHRGANTLWLSCRLKPTADLSHRVIVVCSSIETTAGAIEPRNLSPGATHRIGVALRRHNDDGVHTYRIPALATTRRGTLLAVYDMRRRMGRDLQEDIDIGLSRSTDAGQSWEPARVIMDMGEYGGLPQEQNGCSDPGIIVDRQTGTIFCFAVWMNGKPGKHQWTGDGSEPGYEIGKSAQFLMVRSDDDGRTWSKPDNLTRKLKKETWWLFAPSPQQGIQLADGTLVMPAQGRDAEGKEFSTLMTSRDHGATWTVATPAYSGGSECQAAELGDGSIMLNMRNEHERFRAVFVTSDLGQTWRPHATNRNTLIEPNCNGSLLRVDYAEAGATRHALLFANPQSQKARTHHTIQMSFDDGRTWPKSHHVLLDEGRGAGYPSLTRVDDRHIGIVYEGSQAHLVFEKLSIAELLKPAGAAAAPNPVDVFVAGEDGYFAYRIPALLTTKSGTLLAFCEGRKTSLSDDGDNDLVLRRSSDGGRSWQKMQLVHEEGGDAIVTIGNPCPLIDPATGRIWLSMNRKNGRVLLTHSDDDGVTWSAVRDITAEASRPGWGWYAMGPGVGIAIERGPHRGRLIFPANHRETPDRSGPSAAHIIYSDDHGTTWRLGGTVGLHTNECQIVEAVAGDGSELLINMRNHWARSGGRPELAGRRLVSRSRDGGMTWADPVRDEALIEPTCQASLIRYSWPSDSDRSVLLFANPASLSKRERLTVRLSYDEGRTWPTAQLIDAGPSAYSCLARLSDGHIGLIYERDNYKRLTFVTLSLDSLAAGRR